MTKEEIIEMARQAQVYEELCDEDFIYKFAKLIAEKEREECAKTAENINSYDRDEPETSIAQEIRARGQDAKTKE